MNNNKKIFSSISDNLLNKKVTLVGLAANAKAGACLKVENNVLYLQDRLEWEEDFIEEQVSITGILIKKKIIPDPTVDEEGAISTGAYGEQYVIEKIEEIKKV